MDPKTIKHDGGTDGRWQYLGSGKSREQEVLVNGKFREQKVLVNGKFRERNVS